MLVQLADEVWVEANDVTLVTLDEDNHIWVYRRDGDEAVELGPDGTLPQDQLARVTKAINGGKGK